MQFAFWVLIFVCTIAFCERLRMWVNFPDGIYEEGGDAWQNRLRLLTLAILSIPVFIGFTAEAPEALGWGSIMAWANNYEIESVVFGIFGLGLGWKSYNMDREVLLLNFQRSNELDEQNRIGLKEIRGLKRKDMERTKRMESIEEITDRTQQNLVEAESEEKKASNKERGLRTRLTELNDNLETLKASTASKKRKVPKLKTQIESVSDDKLALELLDDDLNQELNELKNEKDKLLSEKTELKTNISVQRQIIKKMAGDNEDLARNYEEWEETYKELQLQDSELSEELENNLALAKNIDEKELNIRNDIAATKYEKERIEAILQPWREASSILEEAVIQDSLKRKEWELRAKQTAAREQSENEEGDADDGLFT
jgi:DNA repair exonuclease SbcCD ATPase subunit